MNNLYDQQSGVIEITTNDFKITKKKITMHNKEFNKKNGLIIIYAPWCSHCIKSVPIWTELAVIFKNKFAIGAVNIENEYYNNYSIKTALRTKYYPTIYKISKNGGISKYTKGYDINDILEYILNKLKQTDKSNKPKKIK